MRYLHIANARLLDPAQDLDKVTDVYVAEGRIQCIGRRPDGGEIDRSIDANGRWLMPGLVDLGAHLGKGSVASEAKAACASGFTHVCVLPDTKPITDSSALVQIMLDQAELAQGAKILPLGALTQGLEGEQLASMAALQDAGCVALSNARAPFKSSFVLRKVMEYAATFDNLIFLAPDEASLSAGGGMHEGTVSTRLGIPGIPRTAETIALSQMLLLIEHVGVRAHICQISCARSLTMLRQAREAGLNVTADTPLANLVYTDAEVVGYNSHYKVFPPLRSENDRQALLAAVNNGELTISSNHFPHDVAAKKTTFMDAEPGMSMFDGFLPLALQLVEKGELTLKALIFALTTAPAEVVGLEHGLYEGAWFNAILVNPAAEHRYRRSELHSQGRNSPLAGQTLKGKVSMVFVDGREVFNAMMG